MWRWQVGTVTILLFGYAGYYLCRSDLAAAAPLMLADSSVFGLDRAGIGLISSAGVLAYAVGKLVTGVLGDFAGGRQMFLVGLFGAVVASLLFASGSTVGFFTIAWVLNRFLQSAGWGGLVKVASSWFPARRYGTVMAVLSLSFLFGDAGGRYLLGAAIEMGLGWRALFAGAAGVLAAIGVVNVLFLRSSPRDVGLPEPEIGRSTVFGSTGGEHSPPDLQHLLLPFVCSGSFWLVCATSFGLTLVREALNTWIPSYLVDVHQLAPGSAAKYSSLFPFIGGLSTIVTGWGSDRLAKGNRLAIVVPSLAISALSLAGLAWASRAGALIPALTAIGVVAFSLLGPYSLLAGAIAIDFGGRAGSATAAGLIDTAGYLGAVLSGFAFGWLVDVAGWSMAFRALACVAGLTMATAVGPLYRSVRIRS